MHLVVTTVRPDGGFQEPGKTQAEEDVENIWADRVWNGHVAVAVSRDENGSDRVWNGSPGGEECDAHDGVWNAEGVASDADHPDHDVRENSDPDDRHQKSQQEPLLVLVAVRNCEEKQE